MLDAYDLNPIAALSGALSRTLEVDGLSWDQLVQIADVDEPQRASLLAHETSSLDELLKRLVENRSL